MKAELKNLKVNVLLNKQMYNDFVDLLKFFKNKSTGYAVNRKQVLQYCVTLLLKEDKDVLKKKIFSYLVNEMVNGTK